MCYDPIRAAELHIANLDELEEKHRKRRSVKCRATLWASFDHVTEGEAMDLAAEHFRKMFRDVDDYNFDLEEDAT